MEIIRLKSRGESVAKLQELLRKWGHFVNVTMVFDMETDMAVRQFQELYELGADGIVGPKTWAALESKDSSSTNSTGSSVIFNTNLSEDRRKVVSTKSINLLKKVADTIGQNQVIITSTIRFPSTQAIAMYSNLEKGNNIRYKPPGEAVKAIYFESKKNNEPKEVILKKMIAKIEELSKLGQRVSKHCVSVEDYNKLNVIDVSDRNLDKVSFLSALSKEDEILRIIHNEASFANIGQRVTYDKNEPCIHLEIRQS